MPALASLWQPRPHRQCRRCRVGRRQSSLTVVWWDNLLTAPPRILRTSAVTQLPGHHPLLDALLDEENVPRMHRDAPSSLPPAQTAYLRTGEEALTLAPRSGNPVRARSPRRHLMRSAGEDTPPLTAFVNTSCLRTTRASLIPFSRRVYARGWGGGASYRTPHWYQVDERTALCPHELRCLCGGLFFDHPLRQTTHRLSFKH